MKKISLYTKTVHDDREEGLLASMFPQMKLEEYTVNGDYEVFADCLGNKAKWNVSNYPYFWVFSETGGFTKFHYDKGDRIGRGYSEITVLKPFDLYVMYKDYEKDYKEYGNAAVVIPSIDFVSNNTSGFNREKMNTEKEFAERIVQSYFHDVHRREHNDNIDKSKEKEYFSYQRTNPFLINVSPDDIAYENDDFILRNVKRYLFASEIQHESRRAIPENLDDFVKKNILMSDIVETRTVTKEIYNDECIGHPLTQRQKFTPYKEIARIWYYGLGDFEGKFKALFEKLKKAGFHPYSDKEMKSLLKAVEDSRKECHKNKERIIDANIDSLDKNTKREIIRQWNALTRKFGVSRTIYVGKKEYVFDYDMSIREKTDYEKYFDAFIKCLKKHKWNVYYSKTSTEANVFFLNSIPEKALYFIPSDCNDAYYACTLEISERDEDNRRFLKLRAYDCKDERYEQFYFNENNFISKISKFYETPHDSFDDVIHKERCSYNSDSMSLINGILKSAAIQKLKAVCKDFLEMVEKKKGK